MGILGYLRVVGDQDNCLSLFVQAADNIHNLVSGPAVEVSGWFVTKEDFRIIHECPGYSYTLLLATRECVGRCSLMSLSIPTCSSSTDALPEVSLFLYFRMSG